MQYAARYPDFPLRVVTAYGANIPAAVNAGISASRSDVIVRMDAHSRPAASMIDWWFVAVSALVVRALEPVNREQRTGNGDEGRRHWAFPVPGSLFASSARR
ncbi:MAG: hypothetical protein AAB654_13990 [Acidobacteriota bacterium]